LQRAGRKKNFIIMMHHPTTKNCRSCGKGLKGRSDKKFCNDYCRNHFNNSLKVPANEYIKTVNRALSRNRNILESLLGEKESCTLSKELLQEQGFLFQYNTQVIEQRNGNRVFLCYDYGYTKRRREVEIVRKEKISMMHAGNHGYLSNKT
jgi:hypothetical protein